MSYPSGMNVYQPPYSGQVPNPLQPPYSGQAPSQVYNGQPANQFPARQVANINDGKRFPVSTTYGGRFEFQSNSFHVVGSKGGTAIILPIAAMKKLLENLPVLQEQIRRIQFELNTSTAVLPERNDKILINTSKPKEPLAPGLPHGPSYRATLQISTYSKTVNLWLKCFFDAPDKFNPGKMCYDLCCKGGAILNDTDAAGLARFFTECTGINYP